MHIYLLFPLITHVWRSSSYVFGVALGLLVGLIGVAVAHVIPFFAGLYPEYYAAFTIGVGSCALAHYRPRWVHRLPSALIACVALACFAAVLAMRPYSWAKAHFTELDLGLALILGLLLLGLTLGQTRPLARTLGSIPLVFTGAFSYSIYLVHAPLLQVAWLTVVDPVPSEAVRVAVEVLLVTPAIVAVAYLFHRAFERPFMSQFQKRALPESLPIAREAASGGATGTVESDGPSS